VLVAIRWKRPFLLFKKIEPVFGLKRRISGDKVCKISLDLVGVPGRVEDFLTSAIAQVMLKLFEQTLLLHYDAIENFNKISLMVSQSSLSLV
jgi:hypothetical protein